MAEEYVQHDDTQEEQVTAGEQMAQPGEEDGQAQPAEAAAVNEPTAANEDAGEEEEEANERTTAELLERLNSMHPDGVFIYLPGGPGNPQVYTGVNLKEMENFHPFRYLLSYLSECTQKFGQLQELAAAGGEVVDRTTTTMAGATADPRLHGANAAAGTATAHGDGRGGGIAGGVTAVVEAVNAAEKAAKLQHKRARKRKWMQQYRQTATCPSILLKRRAKDVWLKIRKAHNLHAVVGWCQKVKNPTCTEGDSVRTCPACVSGKAMFKRSTGLEWPEDIPFRSPGEHLSTKEIESLLTSWSHVEGQEGGDDATAEVAGA